MTNEKSTEYGGVGQSGYAAGRREHDHALEDQAQVQNTTYPRGTEDEAVKEDLDTDDRWSGRGGTVPHEPAPDDAAKSS